MIKYLIWLQQALGYGNARAVKAIEYFGGAHNIFCASEEKRKDSGVFTAKDLKSLAETSITITNKIISDCDDNDIKIIGFGEQGYPYCLSVIENPPLVLYVKGELLSFDDIPSICIVGPRNVSEFGKKAAYSLAYRLAKSGITIVSGGALGTDTFAHLGALKADGKTVLCLGCGIMDNYLSENKQLRENVSNKGCLISEYPPFAKPSKFTFPMRNRILSALSLGTVVIEAGEKSGALITARHANEQGRDVFVIPGSPKQKEYIGSNALLRDGAKPLLDASDIFNEYIMRFPDKINIEKAYSEPIITHKKSVQNTNKEKNQKNLNETLSKEAKIVYNCLDKQKFYPDEIKDTGLTSEQVLSALIELEMEFLIKALPGGMYGISER